MTGLRDAAETRTSAVRGLLVLAALLGGCSMNPPRVGDAPNIGETHESERRYLEVIERWSRRTEIYSRLDSRAFVAATYESASFRTARISRLGDYQARPRDEIEQEVARSLAESQTVHEFFFAVHVNLRVWDDFDRPGSIWRLALRTPQGEVTPAQVDRVGRPDLNLRALYPYVGDFWTAYRVRFPTTFPDGRPVVLAEDKQMTLSLASAVGKAEMTFPAVVVGLSTPARVTLRPSW